ncbi:hypothetical protein FOG51_02927 [Hanseniaspora uvarum]|uniref:Uncharacterized protein n=1 Tax=Hanseniaspora uvarum TaxID=29833 RepID=A0A1E5RUQ8_HANUV|nr:hypothetical protein FOG48_01243 [Hanseniaspora uvarum]KKA03977.1 hypothetical protein D499_0A04910 [Hanseniaspora uvarum DSM 2768]KAF0271546.1 hypothetical protein FOG51_02927 [Hanseniaspora uvarum]KAF0275784.1 hypothetical protein FOG50_03327 [Hanseniaspora uvarum]OEJ90651.1 hypothetical protein AWRI3580_g1531 [Hanseniaspora uvarum]
MNSQLRHVFKDTSLFTVPPPLKDDTILTERPIIQEIFNGTLVIKEFLTSPTSTNDNADDELNYSMAMPRSSLLFEFVYDFNSDSPIEFCNSNVIDNLHKFREFIRESEGEASLSYDIMVEIMNMRIPLTLKINDELDNRKVKDLLVRLKDEFELIEDMYYM